MGGMSEMSKRAFEITAAAAVLALASPVILVTVLLVKTDGGPALFLQDRVGKDERIFKVIKLRTMVVDADELLDEHGRVTGARITRFGGFLRQTSLDELPQLMNILKGDMSFVGPRPILPGMLPYLTHRERQRFQVRPGVTGLAQVKGRNMLKWSRRFHYDIIYIRKWSIRLEIWIMLKTVSRIVRQSGISQDRNTGQVDDVTTRKLRLQGG